MALDKLNYEKIKAYISDPSIELRLFETTDSTNSQARLYALEGGYTPCAFVADAQTAGRGRLGRSFYSPSDTGLYFSLLVRCDEKNSDGVLVTSAAAVAIRRAIKKITGISTGIKWVNDLYLDGKKVCGILAESTSVGDDRYIVVGVGINLCTDAFPDGLGQIATSLGVDGDGVKSRLAAECISELALVMRDPADYGFLDEYRECSTVLGKRIFFTENGETYSAVARSIDGRGRLYVELDDGSFRTLSSGEISIRPL